MKKIYYILLAMFGLAFTACQTNDITFPFAEIDASQTTELRVLNVIPYTGNSDTLLLNGTNYSSVSTAVGSYYPASAAKYFELPIGSTAISLRFAAKTTTPTVAAFTYANTVTLKTGKWSAYIYNAAQPPVLLQDADNIPSTDAWNDTVCFIKFANFFFKADGVTPYGPLTLKVKKNITGAAWETVASNIAFGTQSSDYYLYKLKNTAGTKPWSGTEPNLTLALFDAAGVIQYQQFASATTSAKGAYSSSLTAGMGKGRAYVFYLTGKEGTTNNTDQALRLNSYNPK